MTSDDRAQLMTDIGGLTDADHAGEEMQGAVAVTFFENVAPARALLGTP